jgi:sigma-E factor negative regulatory protein RseC
MIEEQAKVISIESGYAVVEMLRQSACNNCELNSGCGTGAIGKLLGHRNRPLKVINTHHLKQGDNVIIGLPEKAFLLASLLIYFLPLAGLFIFGLTAGFFFEGQELLILSAAICGFLVTLPVSAYLAKHQYYQQFNPQIIRKNSEPEVDFQVI